MDIEVPKEFLMVGYKNHLQVQDGGTESEPVEKTDHKQKYVTGVWEPEDLVGVSELNLWNLIGMKSEQNRLEAKSIHSCAI